VISLVFGTMNDSLLCHGDILSILSKILFLLFKWNASNTMLMAKGSHDLLTGFTEVKVQVP
jgi:hypothetical protein